MKPSGKSSVAEYESLVSVALSEYNQAAKTLSRTRIRLKKAKRRLKSYKKAQVIVQQIAKQIQEQTHKRISQLVSHCLTSVFGRQYDFRILFEESRGTTSARMVFIKEGKEIDPMSASGAGVVDVASFALRLACLTVTRPAKRRLLVLDEPFEHVSQTYRGKVKALLNTLSQEMGVQIIMVTHNPEYSSGKIHHL